MNIRLIDEIHIHSNTISKKKKKLENKLNKVNRKPIKPTNDSKSELYLYSSTQHLNCFDPETLQRQCIDCSLVLYEHPSLLYSTRTSSIIHLCMQLSFVHRTKLTIQLAYKLRQHHQQWQLWHGTIAFGI